MLTFLKASTLSLTQLPEVTNVIFIKTYKTGSTTVGSMVFRFGLRYGLKFATLPSPTDHLMTASIPPCTTCNISFYHDRLTDQLALAEHRRVVPVGRFVTVMRRPLERFMSSMFYYWPSITKSPLTPQAIYKFIDTKNTLNSLAASLCMPSDADPHMDERLVAATLSEFDVVLILERLDESLVLMKRLFGWDILDVIYLSVNEGCGNMRPWDEYVVECPLKWTDLNAEYVEKLRSNLRLDLKLYEASMAKLDRLIAQQDPDEFAADLKLLKQLNAALKRQCDANPSNVQCSLYGLSDAPNGYEALARDCSFEYPWTQRRYGHRAACKFAQAALLQKEQFLNHEQLFRPSSPTSLSESLAKSAEWWRRWWEASTD